MTTQITTENETNARPFQFYFLLLYNKALVPREATTLVIFVETLWFCTHFAPPHPCAMLIKHLERTHEYILPFSNIEMGEGGVDKYLVVVLLII